MDQFRQAEIAMIDCRSFCEAFGLSERTIFYWKKNLDSDGKVLQKTRKKRKPPANSLTSAERRLVELELLRPDWVDLSPREIYYRLLDEESRLVASVSTLYRVARDKNLMTLRSKTKQGLALNRIKPILMAMSPNEIWSWDVSQIATFRKGERYYLYVIMDIWSRFVVAWTLETHEKSDIAIELWKTALENQLISGKGLVNHKDNGAIMTSAEMIKFVRDAEMVDSYSRAGVSDDNPFSESLFRTIKYFRNFPEYFETIEIGRKYFAIYFQDYNYTHRHSGIQFLFPASRHYGEEAQILNQRNRIVQDFSNTNSHRYSSKGKVFKPIIEVKIN